MPWETQKKLRMVCCGARLWKGEHCNCVKCTQSQNHGFKFENSVREKVFDLQGEMNNTETHDIPKHKNNYDENENCSIKTTGSGTICCGDLLRFYNYNFQERNTIIVIKYKQTHTEKVIENIYEIDYNAECHKLLFGNLPLEVIKQYVECVKAIPSNIKGKEAKKIFDYLVEKKKIKTEYTNIIQINPKVDGSQSRVQCAITNFEINLKDFIKYKSCPNTPNLLRGKDIVAKITSGKRQRKIKS